MAGFRNIKQLTAADAEGRTRSCSFRKVPSQASTVGWWVDLTMAAGNPVPQYYASSPLVAATLDGERGIFHGSAVSPETLHLTDMMLTTPTAGFVGRYMLLDYVLYYPFVDLDDLDTQTLDNTTTLPRYADGAGLRPMLVAAAPTTGGGSFSFTYVNQDGVEKTAPTQSFSTASATIASVITSEPATAAGGQPFLQLASGDTGVRSILTWTNAGASGGLGAVALVKPLADHVIREVNSPCEKSFVSMNPGAPRIVDGAYLGLIVNCATTVAAGLLVGRLNFAWS
jgi:hypothetical protein